MKDVYEVRQQGNGWIVWSFLNNAPITIFGVGMRPVQLEVAALLCQISNDVEKKYRF